MINFGNLNKEKAEDRRYVWSTEKIENMLRQMDEGYKPRVSPFYDNDVAFRKGRLVFKYTDDEIAELKKCANDIIHFACHGKFDHTDPLSSGVNLYDGILTAREIFEMRLTTELVTLGACETGYNKISPGDELIGLTRAFLYAGAPSVIVSLWSVDAGSTHELMLEFYKQIKNGADKATALQKAQIKIMEKKEYTHPYYWAPFVLIGDWQ